MPVYKVTLVPESGPQAFVSPRTGQPTGFYRTVECEARDEREAAELALLRSHQYSGGAQCAIDPTSVLPLAEAIRADPAVPEPSERAELHTRVGALLAAGEMRPADPVAHPDKGDPRPYRVETVERVKR